MRRPPAFPRMLSGSLALLLGCAACGDINVRSVRTGDVVPPALEGEWLGSWQSSTTGINGLLTLRIQDFAGEPVVAVQIAHACVPPSQYQFRASPTKVELLADDVVLFEAVIGTDHTMIGSYGCAADAGSWDATWQRALPELIDLSGRWLGTVAVAGQPTQTLVLDLTQSVRNGTLALDGSMSLPDLLPDALPMRGSVQFGEAGFDLLLLTQPGTVPLVQMTGTGSSTALQVPSGQLLAAIDPLLPLVEATWTVQRQGQ